MATKQPPKPRKTAAPTSARAEVSPHEVRQLIEKAAYYKAKDRNFEPGHELDGVVDALLRELMRQARNKGCVALEGAVPEEPAELSRWEAIGFEEAGPRMRIPLVRTPATSWLRSESAR